MTQPTPGSSSRGPKTLVSVHPFPEPLHTYLSKAIDGHAAIVAAIVNHGQADQEHGVQVGQLGSGGPAPGS